MLIKTVQEMLGNKDRYRQEHAGGPEAARASPLAADGIAAGQGEETEGCADQTPGKLDIGGRQAEPSELHQVFPRKQRQGGKGGRASNQKEPARQSLARMRPAFISILFLRALSRRLFFLLHPLKNKQARGGQYRETEG